MERERERERERREREKQRERGGGRCCLAAGFCPDIYKDYFPSLTATDCCQDAKARAELQCWWKTTVSRWTS